MLGTRSLPFEIPSYSLTGDILSFQRCGLQYRYYGGSSLPPSRPVQQWTGEFSHGMMEEAYFIWNQNRHPFPWPCNPTPIPTPTTPPTRVPYDLGEIGDGVEARLRRANKPPRSSAARAIAYDRIEAAINLMGQHLFPLIATTEEKIRGTRDMPAAIHNAGRTPRGDRYELTGIVDVISHLSLNNYQGSNPLVEILQNIPGLPNSFDIIVDYKAARRPSITQQTSGVWHYHDWQVQTYAWLRQQQPFNVPVAAGIIVYINEFYPSQTDLTELKKELSSNSTDIVPVIGSADYYAINRWNGGPSLPAFTTDFKLRRAIRIIPVSTPYVNNALTQIDRVVGEIELCALQENDTGNIPNNWPKTGEEADCVACDFHRFCNSPASARSNPNYRAPSPVAPG